jgi:hypothetical protein
VLVTLNYNLEKNIKLSENARKTFFGRLDWLTIKVLVYPVFSNSSYSSIGGQTQNKFLSP